MVRKDKKQLKWMSKIKNIQKEQNKQKKKHKNHYNNKHKHKEREKQKGMQRNKKEQISDIYSFDDQNQYEDIQSISKDRKKDHEDKQSECLFKQNNQKDKDQDQDQSREIDIDIDQLINQNQPKINTQILKQNQPTLQQQSPLKNPSQPKPPQPHPHHLPEPHKTLFQTLTNTIRSQTTTYNRTSQIQKIREFSCSETQNILYICGVTGTGKTTTVVNTFSCMGQDYVIFNCIRESQQHILRQIQNIYANMNYNIAINTTLNIRANQNTQIPIIILDQCDNLPNLSQTLQLIHQKNQKTKIVLICNTNCLQNIISHNKTYTTIEKLYFMPYKQEEAVQIIGKKLEIWNKNIGEGEEYDKFKIPKHILLEGAKKTTSKSGDFRQIQKYILNWAQKYYKTEQFRDPVIRLFQRYIKNSTQQKLSILHNIIEKQQKDNQIKKSKPIKKRSRPAKSLLSICNCQNNTLQHLINILKDSLTRNQVLFYVKQWEDVNIVNFYDIKCKEHKKTIKDVRMNCFDKLAVVKGVVRKYFFNGF